MIFKELLKLNSNDSGYKEIKHYTGHDKITYSIEKDDFTIKVETEKYKTSHFISSLTIEKGAMTFDEYKILLKKIAKLIKDKNE